MNELMRHVLAAKADRVEVIETDELVSTAVERMNELRVGSLLVIDDHRVAGFLTERDLLVQVLGAHRDPDATKVREVMTRELVTLTPDDTVARAMAILTERRSRHLLVVDHGEICGFVSAGDLTAWLVREQQHTIDDLYVYITR